MLPCIAATYRQLHLSCIALMLNQCCWQGFAVCPNLPFGLCPRLWDEDHRPEENEDDAALYGSDTAGSSPAATWLLVAAATLGLAGLVPAGAHSQRHPSRTCGLVGVLGAAVGLYLGLELFPQQAVVQVLHKRGQ